MALTLVTGPVRSGKSRYVLHLAARATGAITYVATAVRDPGDAEWETRLARHVHDRPAQWRTVETAEIGHDGFVAVFREGRAGECIVVDALGTWLAGRIATHIDALERDFASFEARMDHEADDLARAMLESRADVIVVTEEVGWDIVPVAVSARLFRDVLGRMKQRLAADAGNVLLIVCGYAIDLRALGARIP